MQHCQPPFKKKTVLNLSRVAYNGRLKTWNKTQTNVRQIVILCHACYSLIHFSVPIGGANAKSKKPLKGI